MAKNIFVIGVVIAVVATVIVGITILGSPAKERMHRLDERRVEDLRSITTAVNLYWTRHKGLPPLLEELSREPGIIVKLMDPETGQPFEYKVLNDKNYELCAHFAHDIAEDQDTLHKDLWTHGSGRQCFQLEVREVKQ